MNLYVNYSSVFHFLAVAKHMSMSQAAKELYISQAALSQSISKLENGLGVTLFHRNKGKLILSKDAEILMPYFEKLRQANDALLAQAIALNSPQNNTIQIGYAGSAYTFSIMFYSNALASYKKGEVKLTYLTNSMALNLLLAGQLDFVISSSRISHPLVSSLVLKSEPIGVALPVSHPLASKEPLSLSDLKTMTFHGLSATHPFRQLCDDLCRSQQIAIQYVTEDDYEMYWQRLFDHQNLPNCVFFSTEPNFSINLKDSDSYVFRQIEGNLFIRNTCIYFLESEKKQYQHEELIQMMKELYQKTGALSSKFSNLIHRELLENPEN